MKKEAEEEKKRKQAECKATYDKCMQSLEGNTAPVSSTTLAPVVLQQPRPAESLSRPQESMPRPPESMPRPPESMPRPPESMPRPPESMPRPLESMPRPPGMPQQTQGMPPPGMPPQTQGMPQPGMPGRTMMSLDTTSSDEEESGM